MGVIKGTTTFFNKSKLKYINLQNNKQNNIIIIDAFSIIYRFCIGYINTKKQIIDHNGNNIIEQYYLLIIAIKFLQLNITPIFVFDGKHHNLKTNKIFQRTSKKIKAIEKLNTCNDITGIKYLKRSYSINIESFEKGKFLLRTMGIPVIDAIGEAEQQCAAIALHYKHSLGVLTDDTDVLLFGASMLHMDNFKSNILTLYSLESVYDTIQNKINNIIETNNNIKQLYINKPKFIHKNLIDISCLMGTDYCNGIRKTIDVILEIYLTNNMSLDQTLASLKILTPMHIERIQNTYKIYETVNVISPQHINISLEEPCIELFTAQCNKFLNDSIVKNIANELYNIYHSKKNNKYYSNTLDIPEPLYYKVYKLY